MKDSFQCKHSISIDDKDYQIFNIAALPTEFGVSKLPFSLKILLENLLRHEDGSNITKSDIEALINWDPTKTPTDEISFTPSRVILQDFTGVPAVVDLAAMRDAMSALNGDPNKINPLSPVELVIDHSVMVDYYGAADAFNRNTSIEFERNRERYCFLRWGQTALDNFKVVPPGTGIIHQVNLEYLARVVFAKQQDQTTIAYPDTVVGTDSHTTMINGLGVLGWGVGGIEAEAAMLGQAITMLIPQVIGFKLTGKLKKTCTATDLVLTIVQMLREKGVVGKFVEFYGDGLDNLPLADRATIANMAPEYGATCGIFPIDQETLNFLQLSGRDPELIKLVETYAKTQGMFRTPGGPEANYTDTLTLNLDVVEPSIAGPKRPQDRIALSKAKHAFQQTLQEQAKDINQVENLELNNQPIALKNGAVVIAAITSCTNTSNPDVMIAAGLLAKNACAKGLNTKPWVKTSLAPGSQVVTDYLDKAELTKYLEQLGFNLVGYGCTTCIGNSGPLAEPITAGIRNGKLAVSAVLSGNRNFEGRIHPEVRNSYLASPPLVVAYALAGTLDFDFENDSLGQDANGKEIYLHDIWPNQDDIKAVTQSNLQPEMFNNRYNSVFEGDQQWQNLQVPSGKQFTWDEKSTYVKHPPYFENMSKQPQPLKNIENARVLVMLGDSVTTDHISPAGVIAKDSPAANYLLERQVATQDFNSYGSRRGNHEIMMRGTFANIRLRNQLAPGTEGGWTNYHPSNEQMTIFDAAIKYQADKCPLIAIAGAEYGTGSSRDWAAKGTRLLGIRVVIAVSFERIHRSNLIGMGVLPLQFKPGDNAKTLGLTGTELYSIDLSQIKPRDSIPIQVTNPQTNEIKTINAIVRVDTPKEMEYLQNDGILHYVLRQLAS